MWECWRARVSGPAAYPDRWRQRQRRRAERRQAVRAGDTHIQRPYNGGDPNRVKWFRMYPVKSSSPFPNWHFSVPDENCLLSLPSLPPSPSPNPIAGSYLVPKDMSPPLLKSPPPPGGALRSVCPGKRAIDAAGGEALRGGLRGGDEDGRKRYLHAVWAYGGNSSVLNGMDSGAGAVRRGLGGPQIRGPSLA